MLTGFFLCGCVVVTFSLCYFPKPTQNFHSTGAENRKKISEKFIADRIKVRAIKMFHRNGTYCIIEFRFFRLLIENEQKKLKNLIRKTAIRSGWNFKMSSCSVFFSVLCQRREKKTTPKKKHQMFKREQEKMRIINADIILRVAAHFENEVLIFFTADTSWLCHSVAQATKPLASLHSIRIFHGSFSIALHSNPKIKT